MCKSIYRTARFNLFFYHGISPVINYQHSSTLRLSLSKRIDNLIFTQFSRDRSCPNTTPDIAMQSHWLTKCALLIGMHSKPWASITTPIRVVRAVPAAYAHLSSDCYTYVRARARSRGRPNRKTTLRATVFIYGQWSNECGKGHENIGANKFAIATQ